MRLTLPVGLVAVLALLLAAQVLNNRVARSAYLATSLVTTALLLTVARLAGLTWTELGLGRAARVPGLRWALVLVTLVALGHLVAAWLPATRGVFLDRRVAGTGLGETAYQVLVRIPLGTVLLEETAFRGVLYGLVGHWYAPVWAAGVSSVLFGLWHVLPSRDLPRLNPAAGRAFRSRPALVVPVTVLVTALAGLLLCEIRRRSGSLLAPMGLHWAVNGLGYLTAFLVTRLALRPRQR
jgi:membrane protease YdiL (CAAX protease family)